MPTADPTAARCFALVPCAGTGTRAGASLPKQYVALHGRPLVAHTLDALQRVERIASILVAVAPEDRAFEREVVWPASGRIAVARCGGATRAATVTAGLAELGRRGAGFNDWILVHDAARCLVLPAWIDRLIDACLDDAVGGLLAVPAADTLKREADGRVAHTVSRAGIWQAQTPQMFRLGLLAEAMARADAAVTDEASAVEALGHAPLLVPGAAQNLKITQPEDFAIAEAILRQRGDA
jgi:2-C-methyl-D-erythritol 4-phosphate cytidylyltransferase